MRLLIEIHITSFSFLFSIFYVDIPVILLEYLKIYVRHKDFANPRIFFPFLIV